MAQFARPIASTGTDTWIGTPETALADLWQNVNEIIPVDESYAYSSVSISSTNVLLLDLEDASGTGLDATVTFRLRLTVNANVGFIRTGFSLLNIDDQSSVGYFVSPADVSTGTITYTGTVDPTTVHSFTYIPGVSGLQVLVTNSTEAVDPSSEVYVIWTELEIEETPVDICTWWKVNGPGGDDGPFGGWLQEVCSVDGLTPPSDASFNFDFFWDGVFYPRGTTFSWTATTTPDDTGWWNSDVDFQGAAIITDNARPKDPRSFDEITAVATAYTSAGVMGGFPGPVCTINNRMVYAAGGYMVGTDLPTIRNFDGVSDREVASLPKTSSGAIPKGIMTMLAANGTVYLTTLDSGTSASDWSGRVFNLDLESGNLIQVGTTFTSGQLPYTLAWHNGRLWMGTNSGAPGTTVGKVYYMRQDGVDTDWTMEHALTAACVCSLWSFDGLLYVGCSASSGNSAKVLVRGVDNAYTTSLTGTGTAENNAFLAMSQYSNTGAANFYVSYWNTNTKSEIWQLSLQSGDTDAEILAWDKVYDQDDDGITIPWIGFPVDLSIMLAIGGGVGYQAALISTQDGNSWTDRTVFLTQSDDPSTGLPGWAIVVR